VDHPLFDLASRRAVLFDGGMGTEIQRRAPSAGDFDGHEGLNEILSVTRPDLIEDIHRSFLTAGSDVVETNSFGANAVVLGEFGLQNRVVELNRVAAEVARRAVDAASTPDRPRFVSGSVGPGTRLPSLGQITFEKLYITFREQVSGLLAGGVDLLQVETCQDPLQARSALLAATDAMEESGRQVPLFCQLTFEPNGTLLLGTDPLAAIVSLASVPGLDVLGINCATGPDSMYGVIRELSRTSPFPISVLPNAGLPVTRDGQLVYDLGPGEFAGHVARFVSEFGVAFAGGCCGTGPEHIKALSEALEGVVPMAREPQLPPAASSLFSAVTLDQDPGPLIIGERTNANGSKAFRERLGEDDLEGMMSIARSQAQEGAHLLDVCLALTGRDETRDARRFVPVVREGLDLPLVYDSTEPEAIDAALSSHPGRTVVNSVNLEDGGEKLQAVARATRRHGGLLVALCIDEKGMCMTADTKVACARRLVDRLVADHGFSPRDLLVDPLTFTLGSGDDTLRDSAVQTLEALGRIKSEIPGAYTSLGVSNVSFGLKPGLRRMVNSVFLHHAVVAGLDAAILNAGRVLPLTSIPGDLRDRIEDLVFNRAPSGGDPLQELMDAFESRSGAALGGVGPTTDQGLPVVERLRSRVIRGDSDGLSKDLDEALRDQEPMILINEVLLGAMKEVGDQFSRGDMQLPFVLRAAEVMKKSVEHIEPHLDQSDRQDRGTIVLATVRGDVHDIGKNLVGILMSNNGYRVVDLGTRQTIEDVLAAAEKEGAHAIGLSGLLVKSTLVMRDDLAEMERRGVRLPVLLGGAALTRSYVDYDLQPAYSGTVVYCPDAFKGLEAMDRIGAGQATGDASPKAPSRPRRRSPDSWAAPAETRRPEVLEDIPEPPFFGTRMEEDVPLAELSRFVNRVSLFKRQWQFKRGKRSEEEWGAFEREELEPMFQQRLARYGRKVLKPRAIWGFFPANSIDETVVVFDETGEREVARFPFPRQEGGSGLCLSDYVRPLSKGTRDVIGVQVTTVGPAVARAEKKLFGQGRFAEYLYLHGMSVELAEAAAEQAHLWIREALSIQVDDAKAVQEILKGGYRGRRFSFGYPACPGLEDQKALLDLLGADRIGISLTDEYQMVPEQSTSAIVLHHPQVRYFAV